MNAVASSSNHMTNDERRERDERIFALARKAGLSERVIQNMDFGKLRRNFDPAYTE